MTFDSFEVSTESGTPVEVFEVTVGATTYFMTTAEDDQTIGAQVYTATEGLSRDRTEEGPDKREHDFKLSLPTFHPLAQIFTGVLPGFRIPITVSKFHRDDTPTPEVVQVFSGFIQSASFSKQGKQTDLVARTAIAALGTSIPRRTFQSACNHVLYDDATCKADDTDPAYRAAVLTVAGQVGNTLTVSSGLSGTYTDGWMNGGFVEVVGGADYRLVRDHVGNVLTLHGPFSTTPSTVNVFAGCDHSIAVCKSKFDNVINFGGFAFVPIDNPWEKGIL